MAVKRGAEKRLGIQSVEVGSRILHALIKAGRPVPLKELARLAGMHPGKVHRYLVSLVRVELVAQDLASGHYGFGPLSLALGLAAMRNIDVMREASQLMPQLRDEIDETVMLLMWSSEGPVVYRFEESSRPVFMNVRIGSILPMLRTAAGRIFAAFLPRNQTWPLIKKELTALRAAGHAGALNETSIAALIEEARQQEMAGIAGEFLPGVSAIGAPVFDHKNRIVAVVGALGRSEEIDVDFAGPTAAALRRTVLEISRRLGHIRQTSAA